MVIKELSKQTRLIVATYLVGGYDELGKQRKALSSFRHSNATDLRNRCHSLPRQQAIKVIETAIAEELFSAKPFVFNNIFYKFAINEITCEQSLAYLVAEVAAQIDFECPLGVLLVKRDFDECFSSMSSLMLDAA